MPTGIPPTPSDLQQLEQLRSTFDPARAMDRVESFAKWIFGSTAVVASLASGLSNAAFSSLHTSGKLVLGLAIFLLGLSLAFAARALAPQWVPISYDKPRSMLHAIDLQFSRRRPLVQKAASCFGFALIVAALAPLVSHLFADPKPSPPRTLTLDYTLGAGDFAANLTAAGLVPGTELEMEIQSPGNSVVVLAAARRTADEAGSAAIPLKVKITECLSAMKLTVRTRTSGAKESKLEYENLWNLAAPCDPKQSKSTRK